jgi:hypothetical protein
LFNSRLDIGERFPLTRSLRNQHKTLKYATLRRFSDGATIFNISRRDSKENDLQSPDLSS